MSSAIASAHHCPVCQSSLLAGEATANCPSCRTLYHAECWEENRGCAVYGCPQVPATEHRDELEIPAAYWGQENKPCPSCGESILAAARRCRHCGATFESARPVAAEEFARRTQLENTVPKLKRSIIWLFVFCALPCTAPFAAIWMLVWFTAHRADVRTMPALYSGLCSLAIGLGFGQTALMMLMAFLYGAWR
jgi:hypothetical protein